MTLRESHAPTIKRMAVMTLLEYEGGEPSVIITGHPDGNDLEKLCVEIVQLINAMQKVNHEPQ